MMAIILPRGLYPFWINQIFYEDRTKAAIILGKVFIYAFNGKYGEGNHTHVFL